MKVLAQLLKVSTHKDHLVTLRAVSKVVSERLSADALENPDRVVVKVNTPGPFIVMAGRIFLFFHCTLSFQTGYCDTDPLILSLVASTAVMRV